MGGPFEILKIFIVLIISKVKISLRKLNYKYIDEAVRLYLERALRGAFSASPTTSIIS